MKVLIFSPELTFVENLGWGETVVVVVEIHDCGCGLERNPGFPLTRQECADHMAQSTELA